MCWLKLSVLICSISISRCSSAKAVCIHQRHISLNNSKLLNAEMKPEVALRKCLNAGLQPEATRLNALMEPETDRLLRPVTMCWNATRRFLSQCQNVARNRAQCRNTMNRSHSSWKYSIAILAWSVSLAHRKTLCLMVVALESAPPRGDEAATSSRVS
jgi:hypothetical protein